MGIIKVLSALIIFTLIFSGCSARVDDLLHYADGAFECELAWECEENRYRGRLAVSAKNDKGDRSASIVFYEPAVLCGIKAVRDGEKYSLELDKESFEATDLSVMFIAEKLLETDGEIVEVSDFELDGEICKKVILKRAEGERVEIDMLAKDGSPIRLQGEIEGRRITANVIWFCRS